MTTIEPGARLVFTHGFGRSPRAAAFRATSPAAIMTLGFEVFVQLVMAAMTTAPSRRPASPGVPRDVEPSAVGAATAGRPAVISPRTASNALPAPRSGTRSCGRRGPAMLGSTVARSSSTTSL